MSPILEIGWTTWGTVSSGFLRNRGRLESAGIRGACCPICCPMSLPISVSEARLPDLHANRDRRAGGPLFGRAPKMQLWTCPEQAQGSWLPDDAWPLRSIGGGGGSGDSSTSG